MAVPVAVAKVTRAAAAREVGLVVEEETVTALKAA